MDKIADADLENSSSPTQMESGPTRGEVRKALNLRHDPGTRKLDLIMALDILMVT